MSKQSFLQEIVDVVTERNTTHGDVVWDFRKIAGMINVLFNHKLSQPIEPDEVASIMICLKLSRLTWNPDHKDSWQDIAGYAACGWECREEKDVSTGGDPQPT